MASCDKCKETSSHLKYNKEDRGWYCLDCLAEHIYEQRTMIKEFEPYMLQHGPIDTIPDDDPNKKLYYTDAGKRVADMDSVYIANRAEEKRYYERMGIRSLEKGEKVQGIKAELKDRPARRTYSFVGNSKCSSCS